MKKVSLEINDYNEYTGFKPTYGEVGESPYYDPYDSHVHQWKTGILPIEQSRKEKSYRTVTSILNSNLIRKYCTICHEVDNTLKISTTSNTSISSINKLDVIDEHIIHVKDNSLIDDTNNDNGINYIMKNFNNSNNSSNYHQQEKDIPIKKTKNKKIIKNYNNLFADKEGVFNSYVKID